MLALLLYTFTGAHYIQRIIPSSSILTIVKIFQLPSQHTAKMYKRRPEYYSCPHYTSGLKTSKASSFTTLNRDKHLAIINRLFADNRNIKTSHLPITFLGMCTQRATVKTPTVLSFFTIIYLARCCECCLEKLYGGGVRR